ncbi:MAG TPA: class I SAM-dependent methyltransferase, partial [Phnomibacter sp.]|nr:class I SAM-dependent methyltransferase [Phnomibacter sp.]
GRGLWPALAAAVLPGADTALYGYRRLGLQPHHRLLDVGCGNGKLTYSLYNAGFTGIMGIEPFLPQPIRYANGLHIRNEHLHQHTDSGYEAILFNHSFEHLPNPKAALQCVGGLLAPQGKLLLRLPTVSSWAWQHYGVHWVQLDAPRHMCIPSLKGLQALAAKHGFVVENIRYEGTSLQLIGSEQYRMDIPLYGDKRSWFEGNTQLFTPAQIKAFEKQAKKLNEQNQGDAIAVVLKMA